MILKRNIYKLNEIDNDTFLLIYKYKFLDIFKMKF